MLKKITLFCCLSMLLAAGGSSAQKSDYILPTRVYVFLSASCPMCQYYAPVLNEMTKTYSDKGIIFTGVFPNYYTTDSIMQSFISRYRLLFPVMKDENLVLTERFGATVTPQVFVVDENNGNVLYSGMINNGYVRTGKRRNVVTEHYLRDALDAIISGLPVSIPSVQPIGCFIVKN